MARLLHHARPLVLEAEEHQPVPARAGDGAGDGRERLVRPALIFEVLVAHRHAVLDALPFADQPGAGDRPVFDGCRRRPDRLPSSSSASASSRSSVSGFSPP